MDTNQGMFIVVEGTDGSGKGTQFELLTDRLRRAGHDVVTFDFPQYDEPSSYFVRQYLNGKYGTAEEVGPYTGSLFYALDRYEAGPKIRQALASGKVVLANRYVGSNMAHQGTKFAHAEERRGYFIWLDNLEFEMLRIPRPTVSFVLRVPAEISQQLVDQKAQRSYTDKKRDLHEADLGHLQKALAVYDDMTQLFPKDFLRIDCVRDGQLMDIPTINDLLWQKIEPMLPPVTPHATPGSPAGIGSKKKVIVENPLLKRDDRGNWSITEQGNQFLDDVVTSRTGNVYAFTDKFNPATIAAAMARLSRRGNDMRITLLDEFAGNLGQDTQLLQRAITAYGDDSIRQLASQHMVVENASSLLAKKLEWGRLGAYLEQSTPSIYFDKKDATGNYRYYTPPQLDAKTSTEYRRYMDQMFGLYSDVVHKLTRHLKEHDTTPQPERDSAWRAAIRAQACDAARPLLPVATASTVGIYASAQALESLILHLQSDELAEARHTGAQLLREARKVVGVFLEQTDQPERGGAQVAYRAAARSAVKELAARYVPDQHAASGDLAPVRLVDAWPRNELDLIPDMLYEHSTVSLDALRAEVATWPYSKKMEIFDAYMGERLNRRHRPGRALEKAHYSWDIICDYGIFRDLQRHRMVDDLEWQELTPRYGYDMPALVEEAGLDEQFELCFDLSLRLHSLLQQAGYRLEAQYATLLGHKLRWKVTYNAREAFHLHELRTDPQGNPGYRKLVQAMHEELAGIHPQLAEAMKFVNKDEDPEMTRLAAERYAQFKLQQL